jgi:hypothetical protein
LSLAAGQESCAEREPGVAVSVAGAVGGVVSPVTTPVASFETVLTLPAASSAVTR